MPVVDEQIAARSHNQSMARRIRAGPLLAQKCRHIKREAHVKKIKDAKKLQLHTETIQTLTPDELNDVPGGDAGNAQGTSTLQSSCLVICSRRPTCCPMF
jgi:hypothetical protein